MVCSLSRCRFFEWVLIRCACYSQCVCTLAVLAILVLAEIVATTASSFFASGYRDALLAKSKALDRFLW